MKAILQRIPLVIVGLLLVAFIVYGFWPEPLPVEVIQARRGSFQVTVDEDGKTRVREKYVVSAPVFGKLFRIELKEGAAVDLSTPLARIEPSDPGLLDVRAEAEAKARVRASEAGAKQAEASLERARETHRLATAEYNRAVKLMQQNAMPVSEFETIEHKERIGKAEVRSAEFSLAVAKFELQLAEAALIRTRPSSDPELPTGTMTIKSPVLGRVLRVIHKDAGVVKPGDELLEIGNLDDMEMEIDVLSTDAVRIKPGAKITVEHWGGDHSLEGAVRLVEPSAFLKISALGVEEQRVNVIADFTSERDLRQTLGDGYRIEASIVVDQVADAVLAPTGVLFREAGAWRVYRVVDGRAQLQTVEIGKSNGLQTEIISGLEEGDTLILHPSDKVADGVQVRVL